MSQKTRSADCTGNFPHRNPPLAGNRIFSNILFFVGQYRARRNKKRNRIDIHFARKNSPEMLRASVRTTTIFWPLSNCLATMLARRPKRCPLPSITTYINRNTRLARDALGLRFSIPILITQKPSSMDGCATKKNGRMIWQRTTGSTVDILLLSPGFCVEKYPAKRRAGCWRDGLSVWR